MHFDFYPEIEGSYENSFRLRTFLSGNERLELIKIFVRRNRNGHRLYNCRSAFNSGWYSRKCCSIVARSAFVVPRTLDSSIEKRSAFLDEVHADLGRCCDRCFSSGVCDSGLRNKKIWRKQIRIVGMHHRTVCWVILRTVGNYSRTIYRGVYWRVDHQQPIRSGIKGSIRLFLRISI